MDIIKDIATILAAGIGLFTLVKGVMEYTSQGATKRAAHFLELRTRLKDDESFKSIANMLDMNDRALLSVPFKDKRDYLGLFEEVAIALNSGLIRKEVAHYMFGYYALRCWESDYFWNDVNRDSSYWTVFADFAKQMKDVERRFHFRRKDFRF